MATDFSLPTSAVPVDLVVKRKEKGSEWTRSLLREPGVGYVLLTPPLPPCQHWPACVRVSLEMIPRGCDTDLNTATPGITAAQGRGCRRVHAKD